MTELTKPLRRITAVRNMPHKFSDRLIITLHPGGVVSLREPRRAQTIDLNLAELYVSAIIHAALPQRRRK